MVPAGGPGSQPIRALHIETSKADAPAVKRVLRRMYSSMSEQQLFPVLGIRMRLVPEISQLTSTKAIAKAERMRSRQGHFDAGVVRITTWEIANLDFAEKEYGCTLRELLMSLCSSQENRSHIRLFHAVEERY